MLGNTQRLPPRDGAHAWPTVVIYKTRLASRGVCCFGVGERSPRDGFYFKLCRVLHCLDCLCALAHTRVFLNVHSLLLLWLHSCQSATRSLAQLSQLSSSPLFGFKYVLLSEYLTVVW